MKTKTTLYLNNALYRRAKIKALEEGRTVSDLIEEGLLIAMNQSPLGSAALGGVAVPEINPANSASGQA